MSSNNFETLERAAGCAMLNALKIYVSTRTHGEGRPIHGAITWRRLVGNLLVDVHPKNHDLYRAKVNGKTFTIARNAPIDKIVEWLNKLNSL